MIEYYFMNQYLIKIRYLVKKMMQYLKIFNVSSVLKFLD